MCEITVEDPVIDVPLSCLELISAPNDCSCGFNFRVFNSCGPVEAVDFSFDQCWGAAPTERPCKVVPSRSYAGLRFDLDTLGRHEWTLHLRSDQGEHTVQLSAEVASFDDGRCFCSAPGHGGSGSYPWLAVGAVGAVVWLRRRRGTRGPV